MKIKTTKNITYLEAKKLFDSQSTDLDFSKIVHSLSSKPETIATGTQFFEEDFVIHTNTRVVIPSVKISGPKRLQCHIQMFNLTQMQGLEQIQRLGHILSLVLSLVLSQILSQVLSLVLSQVLSLFLNRNHKKRKIIGLSLDKTPVEDQILEARPLINKERGLMIPSKWQINMASYMMTWKLLRRIIFFS